MRHTPPALRRHGWRGARSGRPVAGGYEHEHGWRGHPRTPDGPGGVCRRGGRCTWDRGGATASRRGEGSARERPGLSCSGQTFRFAGQRCETVREPGTETRRRLCRPRKPGDPFTSAFPVQKTKGPLPAPRLQTGAPTPCPNVLPASRTGPPIGSPRMSAPSWELISSSLRAFGETGFCLVPPLGVYKKRDQSLTPPVLKLK